MFNDVSFRMLSEMDAFCCCCWINAIITWTARNQNKNIFFLFISIAFFTLQILDLKMKKIDNKAKKNTKAQQLFRSNKISN